MRVLVTRPRPDAEHVAAQLATRGIRAVVEPMLEIVVLPGEPVAQEDSQAILFTSANGVRALVKRNGGALAPLSALPVFAVGDATANAARGAGFHQVESAAGDVAALAALVMTRLSPRAGSLLHVAGSEIAGDLSGRLTAGGFAVRRCAIYQARKTRTLSAATVDALQAGAIDAVTFFSPRTAAAFVTLARAAGVAPHLSRIDAVCLSEAVAAAARTASWRAVVVAPRPEQEALLGCLTKLGAAPAVAGSQGAGAAAPPTARETR